MIFPGPQSHLLRKSRRIAASFSVLLLLFVVGSSTHTLQAAPSHKDKALQIYFVDVEGGQATLFVTPDHESLLVDTGWPGNDGRDADRIVAAAKNAGLSKIDYVLLTHYHVDHAGGAPQLAARIPVGTFIDHGENRESADKATLDAWQGYQKLLATGKYKHIVVKPGDVLPIEGIHATVVSADGVLIPEPLPGTGGENPACKGATQYPADTTENFRSIGMMISFGKLRILDLGDLTRDQELKLMCPANKLGNADIYIVSHHGWYQSGSPVLVNAIAPRVAIMDNGAKKGGSPEAWDVIRKQPKLDDLWQLHYSEEGKAAHNVAPEFIANLEGPDTGHFLKLVAQPDGNVEVFNSRTQKSKQYPAR